MANILFSFQQIKFTEQQIRWFAALLSLIFSLLVIAQDEVINNDGALYLVVADLISQGEWQAAFAQYSWPFFSILISFTSQATGLIPEYAAYLLSTLFLTLVVVSFIDFARLLGGDKRTQILAALVILSLPYLNESREEILRDHGYWLFYLVGLRFLFQHYQNPHAKWGLGWNVAILISCLFRMEGFVIMAFLPFILLMQRGSDWTQRFIVFFQANVISLLLLIVGLLLIPVVGDNLGRLTELFSRPVDFWHAITIGLEQKADVIQYGVLSTLTSTKFAMWSVVLILVLIVITKMLTVLTPLYAVVLFQSRLYSNLAFPRSGWVFIIWAVLVNLGVLILSVVPQFTLQARHTMPLVLPSLVLVPFLLRGAWSLWVQERNKGFYPRIFPVVIVVILLMGIDGLVSLGGYSKQYQRDAAEWIQVNAGGGKRIATTESLRFCYYINRNVPADRNNICQYLTAPRYVWFDYLAIYIRKGELPADWADYLNRARFVEVRKFVNRRNDGILIYQPNQE